MKRVLIFHISDFGGHSKAAQNIKEALLYRKPDLAVRSLNGFGYFYPWSERFVDAVYAFVIKHVSWLWGRLYDRKTLVRRLNPFRACINRLTFSKLSALIDEFRPDCFIATQAFPCGIVADFKASHSLDIPLLAVVTDYHPHRFWIHPAVDKYIVACDAARESLVAEGVAASKIELLGIPISVKFMTACSRIEAAADFGLRADVPTVLIMGGGWGLGPMEKIASQLDALPGTFQMIIVCGKNKKLYSWFKKHTSTFTKPITCLAYTDAIARLMDCADIIITKAGGITISEALAKGLAIVTIQPIPGQEEHNVRYLSSRGAIVHADGIPAVIRSVEDLLGDRQKLSVLKLNARKVSFIDSSLRIADMVLGL
ncbi:MAG: glycosyltransferase [Candidatus Omnitrophota bacterium]|nr:hypothetical protein [Candidatus Omnitrophota bacterium]